MFYYSAYYTGFISKLCFIAPPVILLLLPGYVLLLHLLYCFYWQVVFYCSAYYAASISKLSFIAMPIILVPLSRFIATPIMLVLLASSLIAPPIILLPLASYVLLRRLLCCFYWQAVFISSAYYAGSISKLLVCEAMVSRSITKLFCC